MQFWSGEANHCTIPGCLEAPVEIPGGVGQETVTIDYTYDPLYRLTGADYSSGEYFHYMLRLYSPWWARSAQHWLYDAVGNRLTQETHEGANTYVYDDARVASRGEAEGQPAD